MAMKIKNRHRLKNKEAREVFTDITTRYHLDSALNADAVDIGSLEEFTVLLINDEVDFVLYNNKWMLTLQGVSRFRPKSLYVVVDMGAVGFITKGADVMGPGVVDVDPLIQPGDMVWVCDVKNKKPLVVGNALVKGEEMKQKLPGKVVKTIHYVGDRVWTLTH